MVDVDKMNELGLQSYQKQLDYIENQYLNLIYNRLLDVIQERWEYEKTINLIEWKCAICGEKILADKKIITNSYNKNLCDVSLRTIEKVAVSNMNDKTLEYLFDITKTLKSKNNIYGRAAELLYDMIGNRKINEEL